MRGSRSNMYDRISLGLTRLWLILFFSAFLIELQLHLSLYLGSVWIISPLAHWLCSDVRLDIRASRLTIASWAEAVAFLAMRVVPFD